MIITLGERIKLSQAPDEVLNAVAGYLTIPNPAYTNAKSRGYSVYGIDEKLLDFIMSPGGDMLVPRGFRAPLMGLLKDTGYDFTIVDGRTSIPIPYVGRENTHFRPYQSEAVNTLMSSGAEEGIIMAPPGSGKTFIGMALSQIYAQKTLWLTHTKPLARQAMDRAAEYMDLSEGDVGLIGDGKWSIGNIMTVGLIQTLSRRPEELAQIKNTFGLVILDEAHHCPATTFSAVLCALNPYYMIGLTATPYRADGLEQLMFNAIGPIVARIRLDQTQNILITPVVEAVELTNIAVEDNNVNRIMGIITRDVERNRLIASDVVKDAKKGHYCLVVSGRKAHVETLYDIIKPIWKRTHYVTSSVGKKNVDERIKAFRDKEITVLISTGDLLYEGFDVDFMDRVFLTTPMRSEARTKQIIGRLNRKADGKTSAKLYDYVDTNIGVLRSQFQSHALECRLNAYKEIGAEIKRRWIQ